MQAILLIDQANSLGFVGALPPRFSLAIGRND